MKKILILAVLILFIKSLILFADQDCGVHLNCDPNKTYPYKVCNPNTGIKSVCCLSDPINYYPQCFLYESDNGYQVWKQTIPVCMQFIDDNQGPESVTIHLKCTGSICPNTTKNIYRSDWTQLDADEATRQWNCICGVQNAACLCTLKVGFSKDPLDFKVFDLDKGEDQYSLHYYGWKFINKNDKCPSICDNSIIYLNNTDKFTNITEHNNGYGQFYVNEKYFIDNGDYQSNTNYLSHDNGCGYGGINLQDVLLNAVGRLLGFGFYNSSFEASNCNSSTGIMANPDDATVDSKSMGLSNDDKCMFSKLYCPGLTPVNEISNNNNSKLENIPNPIENYTEIIFNAPEIGTKVNIIITDAIGSVIYETGEMIYNVGLNKYYLNTENYKSGVYFYCLSLNKRINCNKMIVIK